MKLVAFLLVASGIAWVAALLSDVSELLAVAPAD